VDLGTTDTFDIAQLQNLRASKQGDIDKAIRQIYRFCLDHIEKTELAPIEKLMSDMLPLLRTMLMCDPARPSYYLDISIILAPLSITVPVAKYVLGRDTYLAAVRFYLEKCGMEPDEIAPLLRGL
jgi:hypothetical protein